MKDKIVNKHEEASRKLMILTNSIDQFFGNKKKLDEQNGTRVRVFYILNKNEFEKFQQKPGFNFSFRFPNLEKKLQFSIEKNSQLEEKATPTPESRLSTEKERPSDTAKGSLNFFYNEFRKTRLKLSAGLKFAIPPTPFAVFRVSRDFTLGQSGFQLASIATNFWDKDSGIGQSFVLDLERRMYSNILFKFVNEFTWTNNVNKVRSSHGPSVFHQLSKRRAISYNLRGNFTENNSYFVESYNSSIVYRQNLLKSWLFYEFVPQLIFEKIYDFDPRPGFSIKLELSLGEY